MKKLLLTLSLLFYISINAQEYIPMLEEGNSWGGITTFFFSGEVSTSSYIATVSGETLINGKTYKSIFYGLNNSECYIREEGPFIYKLNTAGDEEYILYDFSIEIGDVIDLTNLNNDFCFIPGNAIYDEIHVQNIENQMIAGQERKVIIFAEQGNSGQITWIEGIGSLSALNPVGAIFDVSQEMTCFSTNGNTYYFNDHTVCEPSPTSNIDEFLLNQITLTPNPISETSTLTIPSEILETEVKFYDSTGRLIQSIKNTESTIEINKANFTTGVYFYQIFSENQLIKAEQFIVK